MKSEAYLETSQISTMGLLPPFYLLFEPRILKNASPKESPVVWVVSSHFLDPTTLEIRHWFYVHLKPWRHWISDPNWRHGCWIMAICFIKKYWKMKIWEEPGTSKVKNCSWEFGSSKI